MAQWPTGVGRLVYDRLDSTMDEAARLAPDLGAPTWILAKRQTAGRGRRGRAWIDPVGNFAATLVWRPGGDLAVRPLRSFGAALALSDALVAAGVAAGALSLKWPNDVLLQGRKVAGILLEGIGDSLAVGFGVNLRAAPDPGALARGAMAPASLEGTAGIVIGPEAFLSHLAPAFAAWEERLSTFGFAPLRRRWLENAAYLGERLDARLGERTITGRFETVDEDGCLVLDADGKRERIAAAEIFLGA